MGTDIGYIFIYAIKGGEDTMEQKTCSFADFMQSLKPWLNDHFVTKAFVTEKSQLRLMFADGGESTYRIDDCTGTQIKDVIEVMRRNNIIVEEQS